MFDKKMFFVHNSIMNLGWDQFNYLMQIKHCLSKIHSDLRCIVNFLNVYHRNFKSLGNIIEI